MFESIRSVPPLLKKKEEDVYGKGKAASGNRILCGHRKHSYRKRNFWNCRKKHKNVNRSLVFKWHNRFADERENAMDDVRDRKPSFRNCGPWKMKIVTLLTVIDDWQYVKLQKNAKFQRLQYMTFYLKIWIWVLSEQDGFEDIWLVRKFGKESRIVKSVY